MKNGSDSKTRILALERIFQKANHKPTLPEMQEKLSRQYGLKVERKTLYDDIAALTRFLPIETERKDWTFYYYLKN